ncbi:MAG: sugar phosphate isomerase/epimerase [Bacteroidetes bacterium]|nr:sugar phosphate isomerase/epimerase [Bacteroidota bacterium]
MDRIPIGTMVDGLIPNPAAYMANIIPDGFESFQLTFWQTIGQVGLQQLSDQVLRVLEPVAIPISAIGVYGNPLESDEMAAETRRSLQAAVEHAPLFGTSIVSCFTGRLRNQPIPASIPAFKSFFEPLAEKAARYGVRIAFENCAMGGTWKLGDWNLAHGPDAWELMFNALPSTNVGLEWETCHQMANLIDPIQQLPLWVDRVFHVHGKCANVYPDTIKKYGIHGSQSMVDHRFPGLGDSDWTEVIRILKTGNYKGTIDIEGWHDPVFKDDRELEGQRNALAYLKTCRARTK